MACYCHATKWCSFKNDVKDHTFWNEQKIISLAQDYQNYYCYYLEFQTISSLLLNFDFIGYIYFNKKTLSAYLVIHLKGKRIK